MWRPTTEDIAVFKQLIQDKSTKHDEYYASMLPLLVDHASEYLVGIGQKPIEYDSTGMPILTSNIKIFLTKSLQFNLNDIALKSRSMGTVSYTFNLDFPQGYYSQYLGRRKVRFHAL